MHTHTDTPPLSHLEWEVTQTLGVVVCLDAVPVVQMLTRENLEGDDACVFLYAGSSEQDKLQARQRMRAATSQFVCMHACLCHNYLRRSLFGKQNRFA